jgi:hypothetical protein
VPALRRCYPLDPLACAHTGQVIFDSVPATVGPYTDVSIVAEVPDLGRGEVVVHVTVAGRTSNGVTFVVE